MNTAISNSSKIILDLCGGTGSWSRPYVEAGYDVRIVTLPDADVRTYDPPENVYGVLAAPPCTMFSLARTRSKTPRNFYEGMEIVEACLRLIWSLRKRAALKFWALENPRGYLRQFLGRPALTFDPWEFGDAFTKKTDIWGYFKQPRKRFTKIEEVMTDQQKLWSRNGSVTKLAHLPYHVPQGLKRNEWRAITPPAFAAAFYSANP